MASNTGERNFAKYPKRNRQKVFDDKIWESQNNRRRSKRNSKSKQTEINSQASGCEQINADVFCSNCKRVFRGEKKETELRLHQALCLKLGPTESFLKHVPKRGSYDRSGKIALPLSQTNGNGLNNVSPNKTSETYSTTRPFPIVTATGLF